MLQVCDRASLEAIPGRTIFDALAEVHFAPSILSRRTRHAAQNRARTFIELLVDAGLFRFADGHNTDHRGNPDGDAQDGQNASHLIPEQSHQGRPEERPNCAG